MQVADALCGFEKLGIYWSTKPSSVTPTHQSEGIDRGHIFVSFDEIVQSTVGCIFGHNIRECCEHREGFEKANEGKKERMPQMLPHQDLSTQLLHQTL
jgi:hypothetical protein